MEESEFDKTIYGPDYAKKNAKFKQALLDIEEKHIHFFENREPKYSTEKHDKIHNHCLYMHSHYETVFNFDKESDLPENIK